MKIHIYLLFCVYKISHFIKFIFKEYVFFFFLSSDRTKQFTKLSLQRYLVLNKRVHAKKKANKFKKK